MRWGNYFSNGVQTIDCRFIPHRKPFPLGIHGELNARMPELRLYVDDRFSLLEQVRSLPVRETMRGDLRWHCTVLIILAPPMLAHDSRNIVVAGERTSISVLKPDEAWTIHPVHHLTRSR
ncbi:MAG: hypothetical protein DYH03_09915 [Nitrospira sp. NTP1]|nr:hypothetical protein [Nitrospira sp. NTP1]